MTNARGCQWAAMWLESSRPHCNLVRKGLEISQMEQNGKTRIICGLKKKKKVGCGGVKGMRLVAREVRDEDKNWATLLHSLLTAFSPFLITSAINHQQTVTALAVPT